MRKNNKVVTMSSNASTKQYAVNWSNHMNHVRKAFNTLLCSRELTDVTLYVEGKKLGAHKVLLSACSIYFRDLFREFSQEHPVVVIKGVTYAALRDILEFVYKGEVSVESDTFNSFLEAAQFLQISGLTNNETGAANFIDKEVVSEEIHNNVKVKTEKPDSLRESYESDEHSNPDDVKRKKRRKSNEVKKEPIEHSICEEYLDIPADTDHEMTDPELLVQPTGSSTFTEEDLRIEYCTESSDLDAEKEDPDKPVSFSEHSFPCSECKRVFRNPFSLQQHLPVHSGNTQCYICGQVLSRKYHLKMHLFTRHNIKSERVKTGEDFKHFVQ